jgi:acyl-CoA thioesterase-1
MPKKVMFLSFVLLLIIAVIVVILAARHHPPTTTASTIPATAIRYLPLGDSYTIGQSVSRTDRWPNQLVASLQAKTKIKLAIVANPSVTGYTTQDLIDQELPLVSKLKPQFVSILIGVNDYVQGVDSQTFSNNLDYIISTVQHNLPDPANIILVTIPDYGKTPTGAEYGAPATTHTGILAFNAIIAAAGQKYGLPVANIFPISEQVATDPSLIASDGLHPSGKEYAAWTQVIYNTIVTSKTLTL